MCLPRGFYLSDFSTKLCRRFWYYILQPENKSKRTVIAENYLRAESNERLAIRSRIHILKMKRERQALSGWITAPTIDRERVVAIATRAAQKTVDVRNCATLHLR